MIINSITLKNFKSHKNTTINLNDGISLILGSNGAGKSSILEAISFCLFKEFDGKIDDIRRIPTSENDIIKETSVTIDFKHNKKEYQIKRGKKNTQNIAELREKIGEKYHLKSSGDRNVTNDVKAILEIDPKSFLNAVYIRQGDITELIDKTSAERKEFITKLLNIDSLETAWDNIKEVIKVYQDKETTNKGKLEQENEIQSNIDETKTTITEIEKVLIELEPQEQELNLKIKDLELNTKDIENKKIENDKLNEILTREEKEIEQLTSDKAKITLNLKNIEEKEIENKELEKEVIKLEPLKDLRDINKELDNLRTNFSNVEDKISKIRKNEEIRNSNLQYHDQYESLQKEATKLENSKKELEDKVAEYNKLKNEIELKEKNKEKLFKYIQDTSSQAKEIFGQFFGSAEEIETVVKNELEKNEKYIKTLDDKINENKHEISALNNELKNTKKSLNELKDVEDTCPICKSPISHDTHEKLEQEYNDNITEIELRIEELTNANKNQENIKREKEIYSEKIKIIDISILKQKNIEFININDELKELNKKLDENKKYNDTLTKLNEEIESNKKLQNDINEKNNDYLFAVRNLKDSDDINKLIEERDKINSEIQVKKDQGQNLMIKYRVQDNLEQTIKYLEDKNNNLNRNKGLIQNKKAFLEQDNRINENIEFKQNHINETNKKLEELNYNPEEYTRVTKELENNKNLYTSIQMEITKNNTLFAEKKELLSKYEENLKELRKIVEEQKYLEDYIKLLNNIRDLYSKDGVQRILRNRVRPEIERNTLDIFNEFNFDYSDITLDEDYNLHIKNNNNKTLEIGQLSGGEKIVVALALRLGLAKVISKNKTELLILDEPTIHLDEEKRSRLIEIISDINIVPQMIVVSHDNEMESLSDEIIKINKIDGISYYEGS